MSIHIFHFKPKHLPKVCFDIVTINFECLVQNAASFVGFADLDVAIAEIEVKLVQLSLLLLLLLVVGQVDVLKQFATPIVPKRKNVTVHYHSSMFSKSESNAVALKQ